MRITLASPDVASDILGCWKDVEPSLPPGITIHSCRTREQRQNFNPKSPTLSIPAVAISPIPHEETTGNILDAPKNFSEPVLRGLALPHTVIYSLTCTWWAAQTPAA